MYSQPQRFVATVLLFCILLQSCGTDNFNAVTQAPSPTEERAAPLPTEALLAPAADTSTKSLPLMNEGSGQRGQAYFRIAKQDYPAYTREGIRSTDHALTHIDLHTGDITQQIQEVLNKIPKK